MTEEKERVKEAKVVEKGDKEEEGRHGEKGKG